MPLRCPAGALPEAYRLICLRSLRAFARGVFDVDFNFDSEGSKKCNYCTQQKEKCSPVPEYVADEFADFVAAIDCYAAAREGEDPDTDRYPAKKAVEEAALVLARRVQVTRSQEKELSVVQLLAASHQVLVEIRGCLGRLENRVVGLEQAVASLAAAPAPVPRRRLGRGGRRGGEEGEDSDAVTWSVSDHRGLEDGAAAAASESEV
ncbi:hypothetical protein BM1_07360 [Bipolaris maydis]|nr:hypothetical protein BM1_07360 [Bipolaris maydis]